MQNYYFDTSHDLHPFTHTIPANAGTVAPENALRIAPKEKKGTWPCEKDGKWIYVEDHREEEGFLISVPYTITEIGPLPSGWSATKPEPTPEEMSARRRAEALNRLMIIDADSIRPLRAIAAGSQTENDIQRLEELDAEADKLRQDLSTL